MESTCEIGHTLVIAERTAVTMTTSSSCFWSIAVFPMVGDGGQDDEPGFCIYNSQNHMLSDISVTDRIVM